MKPAKIILGILIINFLLILAQLLLPSVRGWFLGGIWFLLPFAIFSLLGLALVIATLKRKIKGKLKKFLLLAGGGAMGVFVGSVLHNFFYALGILTEQIIILHLLMEFLHAAFFLIGVLACPLGFIIGSIGSLALLVKEEKA